MVSCLFGARSLVVTAARLEVVLRSKCSLRIAAVRALTHPQPKVFGFELHVSGINDDGPLAVVGVTPQDVLRAQVPTATVA